MLCKSDKPSIIIIINMFTVASGSGQGGLVSWVLMLIKSDHVLFLFFSRVRVY